MSEEMAPNENGEHEENAEVFYKPDVNNGGSGGDGNGGVDEDGMEQQVQDEQEDMYKSVLNQQQQASLDHSQLVVDTQKFKPQKSNNKQPALSRNQLTRSITIKPSVHHTVINEFKYIGEQIKVGRFDPNSRSLNENIFQRYWSKHRAELDSKKGKRPSSGLSTRSNVNPLLTSTNDVVRSFYLFLADCII